ncbi:MAG: 50S ribosomal protein L20 [Bacteroidetes bacterium]|nr:50S ribosomal protein L20 [Bacteroidota bacterium]
MPRATNRPAARKRHKKYIRRAKGYFGRKKNVYRLARNQFEKGLQSAYRDRKLKKRLFRSLWITRINAGAREAGLTYSGLMAKIKAKGIQINRKALADLAMNEPKAFKKIVETVVGG